MAYNSHKIAEYLKNQPLNSSNKNRLEWRNIPAGMANNPRGKAKGPSETAETGTTNENETGKAKGWLKWKKMASDRWMHGCMRVRMRFQEMDAARRRPDKSML